MAITGNGMAAISKMWVLFESANQAKNSFWITVKFIQPWWLGGRAPASQEVRLCSGGSNPAQDYDIDRPDSEMTCC